MEISNVNYFESTLAYNSKTASPNTSDNEAKTQVEFIGQKSIGSQEDKPLSKDDVEAVNKAVNKFMQMINADIRFTLHEKTKRLIVQVVDIKEQKVLKEFPPHELLDTLANISDYVGLILDKKV